MTVSDLEPWASAIEMHILGDLEKIFDWGGRNGQEPPHCVFKHSIAPREVYLSLRPNYHRGFLVLCQSEVAQGSSRHLSSDFEDELAPAVSCVVVQ